MKRVSCVTAIAALVATAIPFSGATAQTWEIHQYFGTPGTTVGIPTVNPSATVNGITGGTVTFPVLIRMQHGDSTANPSSLAGFLYGVSGAISAGTGTAANFSAGNGSDNVGPSGPAGMNYANPARSLTGGPAVAGANAPAGNFSLISQMGYASSGLPAVVINDAHSVSGADAFGAYVVGSVSITVAPGTPITTLSLWFREGPNEFAGTVAGVPYNTSDQNPASTTIGYGADALGNPDQFRFGATTQVQGRATANELFSQIADATITVVPEPGTLALLGLGALALRRRRAC